MATSGKSRNTNLVICNKHKLQPGWPKDFATLPVVKRFTTAPHVSHRDGLMPVELIGPVHAPGRGFTIWGGYANLGNYPPFLKKHGLYFSQGIVWDKQHPVLTRKDGRGSRVERVNLRWKTRRVVQLELAS